jgi:RNA polymerase sigma factor (sigma-70 family)
VTAGDPLWFEGFVSSSGVRLRQALVARFGVEAGGEAFGDAIAWGWEHRARLESTANPVGYLYRVGQSAVRPHLRWRRRVVLIEADARREAEHVDVDLVAALEELSTAQRATVLLVHAHGWSYAEAAEVLGVSVAAVTNHVHRALRRLRALLEAQ